MIKANTYNPEFNIVIHAVFIKKIKIGRRLKYGIGVLSTVFCNIFKVFRHHFSGFL